MRRRSMVIDLYLLSKKRLLMVRAPRFRLWLETPLDSPDTRTERATCESTNTGRAFVNQQTGRTAACRRLTRIPTRSLPRIDYDCVRRSSARQSPGRTPLWKWRIILDRLQLISN